MIGKLVAMLVLSLLGSLSAQSTCSLLRSLAISASQNLGPTDVLVTSGTMMLPARANNIFVMNSAVAQVSPGGLNMTGHLYLFDNAQFIAMNEPITMEQAFTADLDWQTFDNSQLRLESSAISHGAQGEAIMPGLHCDSSNITLISVDYSQREGGHYSPFLFASSQLAIAGGVLPGIEVTVSQNASLTTLSVPNLNAYFFLTAPTVGGASVPLDFYPSISLEIISVPLTDGNTPTMTFSSSTNIFLAAWIQEGADVTINRPGQPNATTAIFVQLDTATIDGLGPRFYANDTVDLGGAVLTVQNTTVIIWNIYGETIGGTYSVSNSLIGETTCRLDAVCSISDSRLDGSGGFLTLTGTSITDIVDTEILTFGLVSQNAVVRVRNTTFVAPAPFQSNLFLQVVDNSVVLIADSTITTLPADSTATNGFRIVTSGNGAVVLVNLEAPSDFICDSSASSLPLTIRTESFGVQEAIFSLTVNNEEVQLPQAVASGAFEGDVMWAPPSSGVFSVVLQAVAQPSGETVQSVAMIDVVCALDSSSSAAATNGVFAPLFAIFAICSLL